MSYARRVLLGLLATTILVQAPASAMTARDAVCRLKVGTAVRKYGGYLSVRVAYCHQQRVRDVLTPSINCNDPETWGSDFLRGANFIVVDAEKARKIINSCNPDASIAGLGYTSCPAPCGSLPVGTYDELAECMRCLTYDEVTTAAQSVFGTIPMPIEKAPRDCQERLGRSLTTYYNKLTFFQHTCQYKKERGDAEFAAVDCDDLDNVLHPSYTRMQGVIFKINALIEKRCGTVPDLDTVLNSCATTSGGLQTCLKSSVYGGAASLFTSIYPTVP